MSRPCLSFASLVVLFDFSRPPVAGKVLMIVAGIFRSTRKSLNSKTAYIRTVFRLANSVDGLKTFQSL